MKKCYLTDGPDEFETALDIVYLSCIHKKTPLNVYADVSSRAKDLDFV